MSKQPATLEALLRRAMRRAERMFEEHGEVPAHWLVENAAGDQKTVVTPFEIPEGVAPSKWKAGLAEFMRQAFVDAAVVRYVFVAECLVDPDGIESVVFIANDSHCSLAATRKITRPAHGKPYLGKPEFADENSSRGRFSNLLRPAEAPPLVH
jgi:hypothetical protein